MTSRWGFVSKQLTAIDINDKVDHVTTYVLKSFYELSDEAALDADEQRQVLEYVHKLALGHALVEDKDDERWGDVIPGSYNVGDTVRVRADAYPDQHGRRHNGKRGRIIGVAQAKAIVLYDDAKDSEESFYHEPDKLQRLV